MSEDRLKSMKYVQKENVFFVDFPIRMNLDQARDFLDSQYFMEAMNADKAQLLLWANHPEALLSGANEAYMTIFNSRFESNTEDAKIISIKSSKMVA